MTRRTGIATTAAVLLLGGAEILLARATLTQWHLLRSPGPASLDQALTFVAAATAVVLGAWLALSTVAALLAHLPGRTGEAADRVARAWAPAVSRRVAAMLVGATVTGALAPGTALADGTALVAGSGSVSLQQAAGPGFGVTTGAAAGLTAMSAPPPGFWATTEAGLAAPQTRSGTPAPGFATTEPAAGSVPVPEPGWTPSRPLQRPQPSPRLLTSAAEQQESSGIVVHRGDTLWDIVARHLGPEASDAEVALAWPAWHEANRSVIGDDPDLILPGQILKAPGAVREARR